MVSLSNHEGGRTRWAVASWFDKLTMKRFSLFQSGSEKSGSAAHLAGGLQPCCRTEAALLSFAFGG